MIVHLRRSVVACVVFLVLCGLAYPLAGTGLAQLAFPYQANGSIGRDGSPLIGQRWRGPEWFQGRPDADVPASSGGANLGPRSAALAASVRAIAGRLRAEGIVPTEELVTTSGSGIDPDLSPRAAMAQVPAVARAHRLPIGVVAALVRREVHEPQYGFLGAAYVDVLELNEALARLASSSRTR